MIRQIIHIDEEKCNGCGLCASACHEGAIAMVNGKAKLIRDDYCDGMGDCLPACPTGAITFEEREAEAYDHEAVLEHMKRREQSEKPAQPEFKVGGRILDAMQRAGIVHKQPLAYEPAPLQSQLTNWPVQIKLAPVTAPYFNGADLLIAADCTAFTYANFHNDFIKGKKTLIGCPKLDAVDYSEKLAAILANNDIKSISVVRMQVPCCGGLTMAVQRALAACGKDIPCDVTIVGMDGQLL